jgi:hypothetical protein
MLEQWKCLVEYPERNGTRAKRSNDIPIEQNLHIE